mmetsp:Transcript_2297/g.3139  ORF Transcript_2297/g.3139 Transcript_2297/m.3139 type:complete len:546 (+) Transcript_2297:94-1731(+)
MSITSDEVNFLVYRYLQENGFSHSAFTFAYESLIFKSSVAQTTIPPGALITFLQKGLEYIAIEEHINEDGSVQEFDNNYSLLCPLICDAVAVKEDRRVRKPVQVNSSSSSAQAANFTGASNNKNTHAQHTVNGSIDGSEQMDQSGGEGYENGNENLSQPNGVPQASTIRVIHETTGLRHLRLSGHQGEVFNCLWSPIQNQLATGSSDGMCRLWNLNEMTEEKWAFKPDQPADGQFLSLSTAILPHSSSQGGKNKDVTSITWSPDGKYLATGCHDGQVRIWDQSGKLHMLLREHAGPVFSLKWSKTGEFLLSGSFDQRAIVWSAQTGAVAKSFSLHSGAVMDVDWRDADYFATCSSDRAIHICQVSAADVSKSSATFTGHQDEVNFICWSPGGLLLASCSDDATAKIWTLENGLRFDLRGHTKEIIGLKWTPTGPHSANIDKPLYLCTASFDATVKVWSAASGEVVYSFSNENPVNSLSLSPSPNGELLATGGSSLSLWSLATGELKQQSESQGSGEIFDVSWNKDGSLLCSCFSSGNISILDTAS